MGDGPVTVVQSMKAQQSVVLMETPAANTGRKLIVAFCNYRCRSYSGVPDTLEITVQCLFEIEGLEQRQELTGCWKRFQDRGRPDTPGRRPQPGFRSNRADSAHIWARLCCGDIAVDQMSNKEVRSRRELANVSPHVRIRQQPASKFQRRR